MSADPGSAETTAAAASREQAAEELLPLVYTELRRLAAARMAAEPAGHTLQPTALVHEALAETNRLLAPAVEQPGSLLRRRGRGHAANPH